jgi:small subunit ribosomal protein S11
MSEEVKTDAAAAAPAAAAATDAAAAPGAEGAAAPAKIRRIKGSKNITHGVVHVLATFNNTVVSISDMTGNVISWGTAGRAGFKGSRKSTAYAAQVVAADAARAAMGHGLQEVEVRIQGPGSGRESAVRGIQSSGIAVSCIRDVTPIPHNGCRARKRRRV